MRSRNSARLLSNAPREFLSIGNIVATGQLLLHFPTRCVSARESISIR